MDITEQLTHESRIALAAAAEITRLRARLEVRDDGGPDGILCRDESIRMQDAEIARLRAEVEALKSDITTYIGINTAQLAEVEALTDALTRNGFRRCDIAACNCGSWHYEGGYRQRFNEFVEALSEAGHPLSNENGNTPLRALGELIAEVEALRADASAVIRQCRDALAEELSAYDIQPPIYHVLKAHERCVAWLSVRAEQGAST